MDLKRPPIEIVSNTFGPAKATETLDPTAVETRLLLHVNGSACRSRNSPEY